MRLVFLGTPEFAVPSLEKLVEAGHEVVAVVTQPDRPKGRGKHLAPPPVKEAALRLGLPVWQPVKLKAPETAEHFAGFGARAMAVVGYGRIIPKAILDLPPLGLINVHASLLPKYRGAAPVQWAVANGEAVTGVTTMRIDEGLDTGDILMQREVAILPEETAAELWVRLAPLGAELLVETMAGREAGTLTPHKQDDALATLAPILEKEDGRIDWSMPARRIADRCRGFTPWPGCYTGFRGRQLHVWKGAPVEAAPPLEPGTLAVWSKRPVVGCGEGTVLELLEVQLEGRNRMTGQAFLNGYRIAAPEPLGARPEPDSSVP